VGEFTPAGFVAADGVAGGIDTSGLTATGFGTPAAELPPLPEPTRLMAAKGVAAIVTEDFNFKPLLEL
jgi:hypothetical protein